MDAATKRLIAFRPSQSDGPLAVPRTVRRDLLPQRDDLFRHADQSDAGRTLHAAAQAGRLAVHRPFRIAVRHRIPDCASSAAPSIGERHERRSIARSARRTRRRSSDSPARTGRRFFDAANAAWMVKVFPGEFYVTDRSDEVLVTVLGSCVSACIRDPLRGHRRHEPFHAAAAQPIDGGWGNDLRSTRFGNFAMEKLINELIKARMRARAHGNQGVRRRQRHRHQQRRSAATTPNLFCATSQAEGLRCAAQRSRRLAAATHPLLSRRPDAWCAGCSSGSERFAVAAKNTITATQLQQRAAVRARSSCLGTIR